MESVIRVLLADDHDIIRAGLAAAINARDGFDVVGEASSGPEAISEAKRLNPDLVVMDVRMPGMSGIEACREIRDAVPGTKVLMLTSFSDAQAITSAMVAGASGFAIKNEPTEHLIETMGRIARGEMHLDASTLPAVVERAKRVQGQTAEDKTVAELTEREVQVLDFIAEGLTNREIGSRLFLSEKTVKHHVSDLLGKLGLPRRVDAAAFSVRRKMRDYGEG